jgi:hypothetical protein
VSSLPLVSGRSSADLTAVRPHLLARASLLVRKVLSAGIGRPGGRRLLALGLLGLTLTLSVAGAAIMTLSQVDEANGRLAEVNRALRYHQDADMMHDALRADVAHAQQIGAGRVAMDADVLRAETRSHANQFRGDIGTIFSLELPPRLDREFERLRPMQAVNVARAEELVRTSLAGEQSTPQARAAYERGFQRLVPAQADLTRLLGATTARTERAATAEKEQAVRQVALASLAAGAGWLGLVLWHHRSMGSLHGALTREASHRSAAELLQRSLLPRRLPDVPGYGLAARALPGERGYRVGGDWYDVFPLPTGELGLVVGDVIGHDLPAATAMGQLRNALRAYAVEDFSPGVVLSRVNRATSLLDVVELATCLYAVLDPCTRTVRWASAGHLAPLVSSRAGVGRLVPVDPGPPLGALPAAEFVDHELRLEPGDALALYTDGLVERRGACIDSGLSDLQAVPGPFPSADAMCDSVMAALIGDSGHIDDVTLLVLQTDTEAQRAGRVA